VEVVQGPAEIGIAGEF